MIAIVKHIVELVIDTAKFVSAVWHEARAMQIEAEAKYGSVGF